MVSHEKGARHLIPFTRLYELVRRCASAGRHGEPDQIYSCAAAALTGDEVAYQILHDLVEERGQSVLKKFPSLKDGANYLIRTITHYYVGQVVSHVLSEIILTKASWIANTGDWDRCIGEGVIQEYQSYPADMEVIINADAVVDIDPWSHRLP